jgi:lycopene beta-cyclase
VGWFVSTQNPIFNPEMATFMDFTVAQKGNTRFMYVLPTSATTALVEYTLFSKDRLKKEAYEAAIVTYLAQNNAGYYEINDTEAGSIPMTCYPFEQFNSPHLLHIGTAGGWSKPSTGFTFSNTQKQVPKLVAHIKKGVALDQFPSKDRFWWYDHILLEVLATDNSRGKAIFEGLFKRRSAPLILKFLSQETHFFEELYIMSAANKWRFTKAFFRVLGRRFK